MGKFVIKQTESGFSFRLKAANGQIIAASEVYTSLAACEKGIASVIQNAPIAVVEDLTVENVQPVVNPKFQLYRDKAGEYRFRLRARNGQIIAVSESYKTIASCINGVESVRANSAASQTVTE